MDTHGHLFPAMDPAPIERLEGTFLGSATGSATKRKKPVFYGLKSAKNGKFR
jgi:hypothetical protein